MLSVTTNSKGQRRRRPCPTMFTKCALLCLLYKTELPYMLKKWWIVRCYTPIWKLTAFVKVVSPVSKATVYGPATDRNSRPATTSTSVWWGLRIFLLDTVSYLIRNGGSFPGGKTAGTWSWPLLPSSAEVKERVVFS